MNVGRTFGSTVALRGVTFSLEPGRLHLVVGANGSGKSTLLRIVSTMLRPSFGTIVYRGVDPSQVRACVGWVSHDALTYPDLSGEENLRLTAGLHGLPQEEAVADAMRRFGLGLYVRRPVKTMSRGQRQRIALARALVHAPSLVLLDEPTTGLDEQGVASLLSVVSSEVEALRVVVVVTHDPLLFLSVPRKVWQLDRGRLVGSSEERFT